MFDDVDFDRLAALRWNDPDAPRNACLQTSLEGPLRLMLRRFARLSGEEQAGATLTLSPEPGNWTSMLIEGRELKRLARRGPSDRVFGFLETVARRRRFARAAGPARLEWPDGDLRLRNAG